MRLTNPYLVFLLILCPCLIIAFSGSAQQFPDGQSIIRKYSTTAPITWKPGTYFLKETTSTNIPVRVIRRINEEYEIVQIPSQENFQALLERKMIFPANNSWKYATGFRLENVMATDSVQVLVAVYDVKAGLQLIINRQIGSAVVTDPNQNILRVTLKPKNIQALADLDEVYFIDVPLPPHEESMIRDYRQRFHELNRLELVYPDIDGTGITVGVKEQIPDSTDVDLLKRVLPSTIASGNITAHATDIATIIAGAGNSFYDGRGVAPHADIFPSSFSNLFPDDPDILDRSNVFVQNHSYGTAIQNFYGAEAAAYDNQTYNEKSLVHIFSAGNEGGSAPAEGSYAGVTGFANLTGNFKMAKNVIVVGAINTDGNIAPQSSSGPAYDGRVIPQLVAIGPGGTSDAAAFVSGTVAVMQQAYKESNAGKLPSSALVKAVLINAASKIGNSEIGFKTGYGMLNTFDAVDLLEKTQYAEGTVSNGSAWTTTISIPDSIARFKATLSWTDTAANANDFKALVNDLDLTMISLTTNEVYQPWVLSTNPVPDSLLLPSHHGRDSLNNTEMLSVKVPQKGEYELRVFGRDIKTASSSFALAFHADTLNKFHFTNPLRSSDIIKNEEAIIPIAWTVFPADTSDTGILSVSYNGTDWTQIGTPLLTSGTFDWPLPDTGAIARLRMQTSFGTYYTPEFLLSMTTQSQVEFDCADSFKISWTRESDATGYDIYELYNESYLSWVGYTTDTTITMKHNQGHDLFAVQPVLTPVKQVKANRSRLLSVSQSSVGCYYKGFYYDLLEENKLRMVLEVTSTNDIATIDFMEVTKSGDLLKNFASVAVSSPVSVYSTITGQLKSGVTYVRAKIVLKNGNALYTDILTVISSGTNFLLFYPNPVPRGQNIHYTLKQGTPPGSRILFYDVIGRRVREYLTYSGDHFLDGLPKGILIYRLVTEDNRLLQTGRLVIQ